VELGHRSLRDVFFTVPLALRHHADDYKKGKRKLKMDFGGGHNSHGGGNGHLRDHKSDKPYTIREICNKKVQLHLKVALFVICRFFR
jgi:hypothetical protein